MPEPDATPEKPLPCAVCGTPLMAGRLGNRCPRCLLSLASFTIETADDLGAEPAGLRQFGDYELLEEIARGGMGVVYRARQLSLGREVAVKMILAGELATSESVQRFRNEASTAARLEHPNIVSVYEIGELDMQHFFSMRLVLGRRNIATWAKRLTGRADERDRLVAAMMAKVAHAVEFAHERGVLHRDLKPSNILVDDQNEPQVTDFGLAKLLNEQDSSLTLSAVMLGSPSYMAPEQADGRHGDVTTLTDVYGLGAVLYELLAGRPPFAAATPLATAKQVVEHMPAALTGTARDLATICLKCLAKEPTQRYMSALAVAEDLESFMRGEPIRARPLTLPESVWRWTRRRPKVAALLATIALVFLLGFAGVTWQWRRAEEARVEQRRALGHLAWNEVVRQAGTDEKQPALARLAAMLREDPSRWQAAMLAMSMVDQSSFPMLVGPPMKPEVKLLTPPRLAPDGTWFAAAGEDQILRTWDAATGRETKRITLVSPATALAVAAGPWTLALATHDGHIHIHATLETAAASLARDRSKAVRELQFSADGSRLAARSAEQVEIWECGSSWESPPQLFLLEGGVAGAKLSADGKRLLVWNARRAAVFETVSKRALLQIEAREKFRGGALSGNGGRVSMLDERFTTRSWAVESSVVLSEIDSQPSPCRFLVLNHDGTRVTLGTAANNLAVFDTGTGLSVATAMNHLYNPAALIASGDGSRTLSYGKDGRVRLWDAESGRAMISPVWLNTEASMAMDVSHDGRRMLIAPESVRDGEATISVWQGSAPLPPQRHRHPRQTEEMAGNRISPDGRLGCLSVSAEHRAHLYDLADEHVVLDAPTRGDIYEHVFSPDMSRYYAFTGNGWLHGWSLETGQELWPPSRQSGAIRPADISPDGRHLAAAHNDGRIRIHDSATGKLVRTLDHPGEIKVLRFAPDGSGRFFTSSTDRVTHVWDIRTGEKLRTFTGHSDSIIAGAWSPDSRLIATASYDQTARVWDVATGKVVGKPMPHLAWLSHLEFSPDGEILATACRDGTVRLWHPHTGTPRSSPLPQASTPVLVRFTADGRCLLVRDHLGISFWDTSQGEQVTAHYPAPIASGHGYDSAPGRAVLSPDGTRVHLGSSMMEGVLWTVPQPREPVPSWFPELLESLALMRTGDAGVTRVISGEVLLKLRSRLASTTEKGIYADWARRVLRLPTGQP
ncbi:MAG: protein kinase [Prosthecobacter sp.]|jgi:serine/threonine protein kinase/WD40 repeat protein|uniref:serine/threonine-protein kinase n=1 Tax=Prosthecobacter sp. TaxID=1965333 RepID=UPI0019F74795|nr:protein kinase [Prosthecobacter sp.]MBE2283804.1 protein kinase [Prosthecobacter sp.]